jgi:dienelactone hydrolase
MMRGYGGSGDHQGSYHCDLAAMAMDNGRDIEGVIASLARNPQIDTSRVVVAEQSFGGWNTLVGVRCNRVTFAG